MRVLPCLPFFVAIVSVLSMVSAPAAAEPDGEAWASVGAVLGYDLDREAPLVGIDGRYAHPVAPMADVIVQLQGNYFFVDSVEFFGATGSGAILQFDLNVLAGIDLSLLNPYAGLGAALIHTRSRITSGDTVLSSSSRYDMGLNLIAGGVLRIDGPIRPFAQFRATIRDGSSSSIMLGVIYTL